MDRGNSIYGRNSQPSNERLQNYSLTAQAHGQTFSYPNDYYNSSTSAFASNSFARPTKSPYVPQVKNTDGFSLPMKQEFADFDCRSSPKCVNFSHGPQHVPNGSTSTPYVKQGSKSLMYENKNTSQVQNRNVFAGTPVDHQKSQFYNGHSVWRNPLSSPSLYYSPYPPTNYYCQRALSMPPLRPIMSPYYGYHDQSHGFYWPHHNWQQSHGPKLSSTSVRHRGHKTKNKVSRRLEEEFPVFQSSSLVQEPHRVSSGKDGQVTARDGNENRQTHNRAGQNGVTSVEDAKFPKSPSHIAPNNNDNQLDLDLESVQLSDLQLPIIPTLVGEGAVFSSLDELLDSFIDDLTILEQKTQSSIGSFDDATSLTGTENPYTLESSNVSEIPCHAKQPQDTNSAIFSQSKPETEYCNEELNHAVYDGTSSFGESKLSNDYLDLCSLLSNTESCDKDFDCNLPDVSNIKSDFTDSLFPSFLEYLNAESNKIFEEVSTQTTLSIPPLVSCGNTCGQFDLMDSEDSLPSESETLEVTGKSESLEVPSLESIRRTKSFVIKTDSTNYKESQTSDDQRKPIILSLKLSTSASKNKQRGEKRNNNIELTGTVKRAKSSQRKR